MNNTSRWHLVIASLLYPAFLGNMLYLAIEESAKFDIRATYSSTGLLIAILLIHYVLDYVYTVINDKRNDYDPFAFICDFLIVVFLYLGVKAAVAAHVAANGQPPSATADMLFLPALWLSLEKIAAVSWELRRAFKDTNKFKTRLKKIAVFALTTDSLVAVAFIAAYFLKTCLPFGLLVVAVLADALLYVWHEKKHKQWGDATI